jgi:hypothetical protein
VYRYDRDLYGNDYAARGLDWIRVFGERHDLRTLYDAVPDGFDNLELYVRRGLGYGE